MIIRIHNIFIATFKNILKFNELFFRLSNRRDNDWMELNLAKGHFTKVYSNKGGQLQNLSGILSAVYILYVVIKGMNKVFFYNFKKFLEIYIKYL